MSPVRPACWLVAAVFLALAGLPLWGQPGGKKYALLVGINEYDHANLTVLRFAENDAAELATLLQKEGFEVVLLTTTAGKKEAARAPTLANIQKHLNVLRQRCKRHDILLVALAGHGLHFTESFFCPQDANPDEKETATLLPLKHVYDQLGSCGAGAKLLLVDACRNNPRLNRGRNIDANSLIPPSGVAALFSCRKGEVAFEHETLRHGIFFHHVLQGLGGGALNPEKEVTWDSLVEYVKRKVPSEVRELIDQQARQTPTQSAVEFEGAVLVRAGTPSTRVEVKKTIPEPGAKSQPSTTAELQNSHTIDLGNKVALELVLIPKGKFMMGSREGEDDRAAFEETQHQVEISQDFWMGKYEVTQEQFEQVMRSNPSIFSTKRDGANAVKGKDTRRFPVDSVTWDEAMAFCVKVTPLLSPKFQGWVCRLPTEAEWEFACRGSGGGYSTFHFGNSLSSREANFDGGHPYPKEARKEQYLGRTTTVGSYARNVFGLFDMHGNVSEWCLDLADPNPSQFGSKDPVNNRKGTERIHRGGSWDGSGGGCRSAFRPSAPPDERDRKIGFRVVLGKRL